MELLWMFIVCVHCPASFLEYSVTICTYLFLSHHCEGLNFMDFSLNITVSPMFKVLDNNSDKYVSSLAIPQKVPDTITTWSSNPTHSWVHTTVIETGASNRTLALNTSIHISLGKSQKTGNNPNAHGQILNKVYNEGFSDITVNLVTY